MQITELQQLILGLHKALPDADFEVFAERKESSIFLKENGEYNTPGIDVHEGIRVVMQQGQKRQEIAQASSDMRQLIAVIEKECGIQIALDGSGEVKHIQASQAEFQADAQHIAKLQHIIEETESYINRHAEVISARCMTGFAIDHYFAYNSHNKELIEEQLPRIKYVISATIKNDEGQPSSLMRSLAGTDCLAEIQETYLAYLKDEIEVAKRPYKQLEEGEIRDIVIDGKAKAGVLFHEAVGHPFEEDICKHGPFKAQWEDLQFHPSVNVVDNPLLEGSYGSYNYDHEATKAQKTYLIKEGKPSSTMKSRYTSKAESTGHGRREAFLNESLVRMSNTYLDAGEEKAENIIASVKDGIYIKAVGGGQVNIVTGEFMFVATDAYMIKDGVVQEQRYSNITLKGSAVEVLQNISMVADDLDFSIQNLIANTGTCGKGQSMRVGLASPTFKTRMYVA